MKIEKKFIEIKPSEIYELGTKEIVDFNKGYVGYKYQNLSQAQQLILGELLDYSTEPHSVIVVYYKKKEDRKKALKTLKKVHRQLIKILPTIPPVEYFIENLYEKLSKYEAEVDTLQNNMIELLQELNKSIWQIFIIKLKKIFWRM